MLTHFENLTTYIEPGDHICFLNETESELRTALSHQLSQGLEHDEKLLYISHENNLESIQTLLKDFGENRNDYLQSRQIEIINWNDFHFSEGAFDPNRLIDRLRQETNRAVAGGYSALRVISEMTWTLDSSDDIDLLIELETCIDEFSHSSLCIFTCLYDMGKYESEVLMDVLRRHPKVALNNEIYENDYYIPPEIIKHTDPKGEELKNWLHNIIKHKRLQEQLYEGLFDRIPIGLCISTPKGKYIDANNSYLKILGFPDIETLLASKIEDSYVNLEDRFRWMDSIVKQSPLKGNELQVRKFDGTPIWVRMNAEAVRDNNDNVIFYEIGLEDITDRKQMQELLHINEERFRNLFETMSEGVVYFLPDGQIPLANPAAERILGLERDETEGRNYISPEWDILRSDGTPMQPHEMAGPRAIKEMQEIKNEVMGVVRPDSSISWINVNATPLIDKSGNIEGVVGTFSDVTEQVLSQESLQKSEKQLQDLINTMSEGVVYINPSGQIVFSNAAAQKILGLDRNELENRNIASPQREIFHADRTPMQPGELASSLVMNEMRPVNDVVTGVKHQDGSLSWLNSNATPLINNEGKLEGILVTFTDITRHKQADDELLLSLEQIKRNQMLLLGLSRTSEAVQRTRSSYQQVYETIGEGIAELGLQTLLFILSADGKYLELQDYHISDSIVNGLKKFTGLSPHGFSFPLKPGGYHKRLLDRAEVVLTNPGLEPINEMLPEYLRPLSKKLASMIGLDQVIYAPLIVNDQSFGLLAVLGHGMSDDDIPGIKTLATHASIAIENTMLFDAQRKAHQQMIDLTNYLQVGREEERTYMAREIHDEFGQRLTALKMDISWLTNHLPEVDTAIVEKMSGMSRLVDESIQLVRQVAADLRPGLLDDLGLTAALEWQAQDFTKRTGIEYDLHFGDTDIPPVQDRDTVFFRVFQEALTNITRHSKATKITVNLTAEHDFIQLRIHDNGIGITSDSLNGSKSLGLLGMRERARSLGGDVEINGIPDQGTTVLVKVPN